MKNQLERKQFEGKLVRFDTVGVGVVDVKGADQYLYFKPKHIAGYRGETVDELRSPSQGNWANGKIVVVDADIDPSGNVHVSSVHLK